MVNEGSAYRDERRPHPPGELDRGIAELAGRQAGVVCVEQLHRLGGTRAAISRRVRKGLLHPLHRGVYAVGHTAVSRSGWQWAAVLACGPDAVLSHTTAAARWGLLKPEAAIEVTTPRTLRPHAGIAVHRTRRLDPADRASIGGVPVTSVHRTLVDLAEVLAKEKLAKAVHESEVRGLFDLRELLAAQGQVPGRRGRHRLLRVCAGYAPPPVTRSEAERLFRELLADHALPLPQTNATRCGYELDCFWPDARLNVEVDGAASHKTIRAFHADRRRDRALQREGIAVVRVTWEDLGAGRAEMIRDLREILGGR